MTLSTKEHQDKLKEYSAKFEAVLDSIIEKHTKYCVNAIPTGENMILKNIVRNHIRGAIVDWTREHTKMEKIFVAELTALSKAQHMAKQTLIINRDLDTFDKLVGKALMVAGAKVVPGTLVISHAITNYSAATSCMGHTQVAEISTFAVVIETQA